MDGKLLFYSNGFNNPTFEKFKSGLHFRLRDGKFQKEAMSLGWFHEHSTNHLIFLMKVA